MRPPFAPPRRQLPLPILACFAAWFLLAGCASAPTSHILFIGNRYTAINGGSVTPYMVL